MSILRADRTEIIANNQRKALAKANNEPSPTSSRRAINKQRLDDVNFARELERINNYEH